MWTRQDLHNWLTERGFYVKNNLPGLLSVGATDGTDEMYLHSIRWYIPWIVKTRVFIEFKMCNPLKSNRMVYSNQDVRAYLGQYYSPSFRKADKDYFYNFRNRKLISVPEQSLKSMFTEQEIVDLFDDKTEHPAYIECVRFRSFISNPKTPLL